MLSRLRSIEIEIHSKCNRQCPWCYNREFSREYEEMPENMFLDLLADLKENNFKGIISFARFHELFYNIELLKKRVSQIKKELPLVKIHIHSNGDFVDKDSLIGLDIDRLFLMDYDCSGLKKCTEKINLLSSSIEALNKEKKTIIRKTMNVKEITYRVDWPINTLIDDRAGYLKEANLEHRGHKLKWKNQKEDRKEICVEPIFSSAIDFNGTVLICSHVRSDTNKNYILGNIGKEKFSEIMVGKKFKILKDILISGDFKRIPENCKKCSKKIGSKIIKDYYNNRNKYV